MIQFLLNNLGVKVDAVQQVSAVSFHLRHDSWLGWIVFIALLLSVFTWWVYRYVGAHRQLPKSRRILLTTLRILLFLLLLFILLRPVFSFTVENRLRRTLIALVDKSASMDIPDMRREDADIKRAAIALGKIEQLRLLSTAENLGLLSLAESAATTDGAVVSSLGLPFFALGCGASQSKARATVVYLPPPCRFLLPAAGG